VTSRRGAGLRDRGVAPGSVIFPIGQSIPEFHKIALRMH